MRINAITNTLARCLLSAIAALSLALAVAAWANRPEAQELPVDATSEPLPEFVDVELRAWAWQMCLPQNPI